MNRIILSFCILLVFSSSVAVYARDVEVTYLGMDHINKTLGTSIIHYSLVRDLPKISADQPIWIFVKYRLANESNYLDWKDTDDLDPTNDDSDGRFYGNNGSLNGVCNTVNKNLGWSVGIVDIGGENRIGWIWGAGGTGVPPEEIDSVEIAIYAIEMVRIPGGEITFGSDLQTWNPLQGGTAIINDFYMTKYPVTTGLYAAFLNSCANRHDIIADIDHDFYYEPGMNGSRYCFLKRTSGSISAQNAVFAAVSDYENFPITNATWYNAYDFAKWAGLRMVTGEEFEYEATNGGTWNFPWGDKPPNSRNNICANMKDVMPFHASDVRIYDEGVEPPNKSGLSIHGVAELSGNAWLWCFTIWYQGNYDGSNSVEPNAEYGPELRVMRSGAYLYEQYRLRGAGRSLNHPGDHNDAVGFILGKDVSP